eukprot:CAMPEP_0205906204 /NCGR_PEP_ID=MMETSP1325-20131115/1812_1 /ASSEMBLY_ACC=CAM_ASM_000708 /TAXON_ID=236786 /ORGANISM="Florenciella sp., Strain RCC1007" /LENGTH=86 /DNA_ID=CAMNT_0053272201 /DNA_START=1 /DNA_END=261 /DNA_ORIENTATION=-
MNSVARGEDAETAVEEPLTPNTMAASRRRSAELAAALLDDLFGDEQLEAPDPPADSTALADEEGDGDGAESSDGYEDEFDEEDEEG